MEVSNLRDKIIKAGRLTLMVAIMIALTRTFITDLSSNVDVAQFDIPPNSQNIEVTLWNTRTHRVVVDVSPAVSRINMYLLDEEGIRVLHDKSLLQPTFSLEDVDGCDFTYRPAYSGLYALLLQNNSNQTTTIMERVISQGLEWDILQFSAALAIVGLAMSLLPRILRHRRSFEQQAEITLQQRKTSFSELNRRFCHSEQAQPQDTPRHLNLRLIDHPTEQFY